MMSVSKSGHIYVLTSPTCKYVKIGGTDHAPLKRIREINAAEPYRSLGPWTLHDFRQVIDWRKIERLLHYTYRGQLVRKIARQKELFTLSAVDVSKRLEGLHDTDIVRKPKVDRMFQEEDFVRFLGELLRITGLVNWLDLQGAWTFCLFPSTAGGRFYTLNIGRHEVAFATSNPARPSTHMIHMDRLVAELPHVERWLVQHSGFIENDNYTTALDRSTSVFFEGDFGTALEFMRLPGVRRAIVAYWTEALLELKERGSVSVFSRFHNWNAIAALKKRLVAGEI